MAAFRDAQRRYYSLGEGGFELGALLADDVRWHVPGTSAIAGEHRGRAAVLRYFDLRRDLSGGTLRITLHGELHAGDLVVQQADGSAELNGQRVSWRTVGAYRIAQGRIAECWLLPLDQAAFDRAWASPGEDSQPTP